jgi:hypothetical protein
MPQIVETHPTTRKHKIHIKKAFHSKIIYQKVTQVM